jgi:hypothetical protein
MSYGYRGYEQSWPAYPQPGFALGTPYLARRSAPASVHVVAILQYLGGLLVLAGAGVLAGLAAGVVSAPHDPNVDVMTPAGASRLFAVAAGFLAVCGLVAIVLGRKVQRGRSWARVVLIVLNVISVLATLYQSFAVFHDTRYLAGLALPVLYLILLNTRAARAWCRS